MRTKLLIIAGLVAACAGCNAQTTARNPAQPSSVGAPVEGEVTISGMVYEHTDQGEPPIPDALITASSATQSTSTRSVADGFYVLTMRSGRFTITASKEGHQSRTLDVIASKDSILNFGLPPL